MGRILTKRRVAFVAVVGAAVALLSHAAGAVKVGSLSTSPAKAALAAGGAHAWEDAAARTSAVGSTLSLAAAPSCVSAANSRSVMTHSMDTTHHVWVVHVAKRLCSVLFAQDAAYRKPLQGGRDFPQTLFQTGKIVKMQPPGVYRVPIVARTSCVQTDTGASWGSAPRWPRTLTTLGVTQPQQLSHWSRGPNTWWILPPARCAPFLPPPPVAVSSHCPLDCTGIATVTVSAHNTTTFAQLKILPFVNGKAQPGHMLTVLAGRGGSVSFKAKDGDVITVAFQYQVAKKVPFKGVGKPVKVDCPPGAPPVVVTFSCPCAGDVTGTVQVTDNSRFALQVSVAVNGVQKAVLTVAAHKDGSVTLPLARSSAVTFGFRYNVGGKFPAAFTPIKFKVTTSA